MYYTIGVSVSQRESIDSLIHVCKVVLTRGYSEQHEICCYIALQTVKL